ncbi:hypothetical protein Tco_0256085 [Tanacetum coccineum]
MRQSMACSREANKNDRPLRDIMAQEEALGEFDSTLENILEKLSQEKDIPNDFYGFMYDTSDDASISGRKAWKDDDVLDVFGLDSSIDERYGRFKRRAWKLMFTSKRYAWPNCKVSKACSSDKGRKAWKDDDVLDVFGLDSSIDESKVCSSDEGKALMKA